LRRVRFALIRQTPSVQLVEYIRVPTQLPRAPGGGVPDGLDSHTERALLSDAVGRPRGTAVRGREMTRKRQFCPKGHDTFQVGRDASKRCLQCKAEEAAARAALEERAVAEAHAAFERLRAEASRRREQEYQAAIKRGGYDAAMARWNKAYGETNGRYGLCQWEDEVDGEFLGRMCYRRTTDVYCHLHNRQLERESEHKRKAEERETAAATRASTPASSSARARQPRLQRPTSNWAAYKRRHPERARFYSSSTWRNMRDRQLREYPDCVVCGQKAGHADHVLAISLGGSEDGQLRSLCKKHHHEKTVSDSHEAAKQAAQRRKRTNVGERRNR
jgi:hypothetical protein